MRHEDDPMSSGSTDRNLAFLSVGVIWVGIRPGQRVEENRCRIVKGYAVLLEIGLRRVPLLHHRFSLPQRNRRTSSLLPRTRSFSASASETNARGGIPCSAAADLACLKSASGISRVVFIHRPYPIFMGVGGI